MSNLYKLEMAMWTDSHSLVGQKKKKNLIDKLKFIGCLQAASQLWQTTLFVKDSIVLLTLKPQLYVL